MQQLSDFYLGFVLAYLMELFGDWKENSWKSLCNFDLKKKLWTITSTNIFSNLHTSTMWTRKPENMHTVSV